MTHDEALARVQKLLRLSKSDNANEAAVAAAMAQKIIDLHKFDVAALEGNASPSEPVQSHREAPIDYTSSTWKLQLVFRLAEINNSKGFTNSNFNFETRKNQKYIFLVGRKSDVQTVRYMYQWLGNEVERITTLQPKGYGKTWYNNFRHGMVETIIERLQEEKKKTEQEAKADAFAKGGEAGLSSMTSAIVKVNATALAVDDFVAKVIKPKKGTAPAFTGDFVAHQMGRQAGRNVKLAAEKNLGEGQGKLR